MAFKIYTKTGDEGYTGLMGGTRVSKAHLRIDAYGTVDELNSYIGLCLCHITDPASTKRLQHIQDTLFVIGSILACDPGKELSFAPPTLHEDEITILEQEIDRMEEILPPLKNFILPGGHIITSHLHIARCICRRAERCIVRLESHSAQEIRAITFMNRLSDYLFVLARYSSHLAQAPEINWRPRS